MSLYLRNTLFFPGKVPTTILIPEESAVPNIWAAANGMRVDILKKPPEKGAIDIEVFEWDGDLVSASLEANRRGQERMSEAESHKNVLHDHIVMIMKLGRLEKGGLIETIDPSPLGKTDIMEVFLKVVKRPEYDGYVLCVHDQNGEPVRLHVDKET